MQNIHFYRFVDFLQVCDGTVITVMRLRLLFYVLIGLIPVNRVLAWEKSCPREKQLSFCKGNHRRMEMGKKENNSKEPKHKQLFNCWKAKGSGDCRVHIPWSTVKGAAETKRSELGVRDDRFHVHGSWPLLPTVSRHAERSAAQH